MAADPIKSLEKMAEKLDGQVKAVLWKSITAVRDRLKRQLLAGNPIQKRTRGIPVVRIRPERQGNLIVGGVRSPVSWAGVHFGPKGSETTISAKDGMLAIPTDFVKTFRGKKVGPKRYAGVKIIDGIIFGQVGWHGSQGLRQRRAAGERFKKSALVPLYILKKSIVVRRRVDPQTDLIPWVKPQFFAELAKILKK